MDDDDFHNRRKRYKAFLDHDYKKCTVTPRTDTAWNNLTTEGESLEPLPTSSSADEHESNEYITPDNVSSSDCEDGCSSHGDDDSSDISDRDEANIVPENTAGDARRNFVDVPEFQENILMFEASGLATADVLLMIMAFSIRFSLSQEGRNALIQFVKTLAGPQFVDWDTSNYKLSRQFDPPDEVITYHFYCESCYEILAPPTTKRSFNNSSKICESCEQHHDLSLSSTNHFISIDLEYQLKILLDDREIKEVLLDNLEKIRVSNNIDKKVICDVHDGVLYRNVLKNSAVQAEHLITFNFNTDGAPLFHSSKRSFWPLQIILNELPPKLRFRHILLAGLWIGKREPSPKFMNTYLAPFVAQTARLRNTGFTSAGNRGEIIMFKLAPIACCVDSVARPVIQNRIQYNGYMGCSWCYTYGHYSAGAMRYPLELEDSSLRTHNSHITDSENAATMNKPVKGVKGSSILAEWSDFDMVWGCPADYLHGQALGVARQLLESCTTPGSAVYLTPSDRAEINTRLKNITPTHEIHRLPRTLTEKAKWKGSEWRSWLLFYCLPCLRGIVEPSVLEHFALFSGSMFTLLQDHITEEELRKCEYNLLKFVGECQIIYGEKFMTFNVHSMLHLVQSVKMSGPLWATSTFPYESAIYYLKRRVNGPKGVGQQMSTKHLQASMFDCQLRQMTQSDTCLRYCDNLFSYTERATFTRSVHGDAVFFGKGETFQITPELMHSMNIHTNGVSYDRCIYRGTVMHSINYERAKTTNDTVVQLKSGSYVQITKFIKFDDKSYIQAKQYAVGEEEECFDVPHILSVKISENVTFVSIEEIKRKCLLVGVENHTYVCLLPNVVEIQ